MNVTLKDVAHHAEVSIATVDRVLHERAGVSARSRQRVKEAIHELGFGRLPPTLTRNIRGRLRFLFLLPELSGGFVQQLIDQIRRAQGALRDVEVLIDVERVPATDGAAFISRLARVDPARYRGVGLFAIDAPGVQAAIDAVTARGVPVVTLVSDVPSSSRTGFVGVDNVAAGRTAGRLMGKFLRGLPGEIGVITGGQQIRDRRERHLGLKQVLGTAYRDLRLLPPVQGGSSASCDRAIAIDLLRDHPRLVGLYSVGGDNAGILAALEAMQPARRPVVIMHELTAHTTRALESGLIDAVIAQDTFRMARCAIRRLSAAALGDTPLPAPEPISISIHLAENLP